MPSFLRDDPAAALCAELAQIAHRFFYFLDESRYDELIALMHDDAIWHRQGKVLRGHGEVRAALEERPRTQRVRHVISNAFVDDAGAPEPTLLVYMTAYRYDDGKPLSAAPIIDGPFRLSVVHTRFARRESGWRIAEQVMRPEFEFAARPRAPGA